MPETPEELYARVVDADRPPLDDLVASTTFPWEVVDGSLVAKRLQPPHEEPVARTGAEDCPICASYRSERTIWEDERFFVSSMFRPSGLLIVFLQTKEHLDYTDMGDDLAADAGRWQVVLCRIMERLPHVAQVYVTRYGSAAEHMHVWFIARPAGFPQIRGSLAVEYDAILPPIPDEIVRQDVHEIARELATHGGRALV